MQSQTFAIPPNMRAPAPCVYNNAYCLVLMTALQHVRLPDPCHPAGKRAGRAVGNGAARFPYTVRPFRRQRPSPAHDPSSLVPLSPWVLAFPLVNSYMGSPYQPYVCVAKWS